MQTDPPSSRLLPDAFRKTSETNSDFGKVKAADPRSAIRTPDGQFTAAFTLEFPRPRIQEHPAFQILLIDTIPLRLTRNVDAWPRAVTAPLGRVNGGFPT